jgi:hypothetical protein
VLYIQPIASPGVLSAACLIMQTSDGKNDSNQKPRGGSKFRPGSETQISTPYTRMKRRI